MKKIIYIWLVKFFSKIYQTKSPDKIVYVMSFSGNYQFIHKLARTTQKYNTELVVLYLKNCEPEALRLKQEGIEIHRFSNNLKFLVDILPIIMKARLLICDNYFAFLSGIKFNHQLTHIVQIWHANGAIKSFGWDEPKTLLRSKSDQKRFQKVYNQFDEFIVGSRKMGEVFEKSYHVSASKISVIGYPRTDELFNYQEQQHKINEIYQKYPELKDKEVLLYAPTYRENENGVPELNLPNDFIKIFDYLNDNQRIIIKLHPHLKEVQNQLKTKIQNSHLVWVDDFSTNDLLFITDRLITDYSSVIFDYSLLKNSKQIIFYCYDYDEYSETVGIQKDFKEWIPGPFVTKTDELINILEKPIVLNNFRHFNEEWNTKNDGNATQRVLQHESEFIN